MGKRKYLIKNSKIIWKDKGSIAKNNSSAFWCRERQIDCWKLTSESVSCGPTHGIGSITWELIRNTESQASTPDQLSQNLF